MEYNEQDYLYLSGIQHFDFCRRQWALIHIQQVWKENSLTYTGNQIHRKAHNPFLHEKRKGIVISRALPVSSTILGVSGECDVVEFLPNSNGINIHGWEGKFEVVPIEYKRGSGEFTQSDSLQLCAQAICLEEMLCCSIPSGYIYYNQTNKKVKITFTHELRDSVTRTFQEMHNYYRSKYIPRVKKSRKCSGCSLQDYCENTIFKKRSAIEYNRRYHQMEANDTDEKTE